MAHLGHDLLQRLSENAGIPSGVHLQIADRCNHVCRHCYQVQGLKGELELPELKAILDDLASAGVMLLNVSGGEATLRPDLLDLLRYARGRGFAVRLFTNGYTMTPELAQALADIGLLGVDVSVYSDDAAQHDFITRVPGSHARTVAGVRAMVAAGLRVHLKVPATSVVPDAGARIRKLAASIDPGISVVATSDITPMETGSLASREMAADPDELARRGIIPAWSPAEDHAEQLANGLGRPTCGACREGVAILPNGDLRPCTDIAAPLGNLVDSSFRDLYAGSGAQLVRALTWNDIHGCRDCDLRPACERCHAAASQEGGDLLGPYPAGCAGAVARYRAATGELRFEAPAEDCEPGRDPRRGPFRIASPGVLAPIPDVVSEQDRARREAFPWVTPSRSDLESMARGNDRPRRRLPLMSRAAV
jgi:AdoMet-dependent heme synthase